MAGETARERELEAELHTLRRRLAKLEERLQTREQELETVLNSHSFRVTRPLRWLRRILAGNHAVRSRTPAHAPGTAVDGFPLPLRRASAESDPNESHRILDLDPAIQPLLDRKVRDGGLPAVPPGTGSFLGWGPKLGSIATLASRELREELSFDAQVTPLHADGWGEILKPGAFDYLLIESAWEPEGNWGVAFAGTGESRDKLEPLLAHCRSIGLKIVLWAREDAEGLDRVAWLAASVDRVYSIDEAGLAWFQKHVPGVPLRLLPPAIQPALHNPVRSYELAECQRGLAGTVLLDGWWDLQGPWAEDPLLAELGDRARVLDSQCDYSWARLRESTAGATNSLGVVTPLEKLALLKVTGAELFLPGGLRATWRQQLDMLRAVAAGASVFWPAAATAPRWAAQIGGVATLQSGSAASDLQRVFGDPLARARHAHAAMREVVTHQCLAARLRKIAEDLQLGRSHETPPQVAHVLVTMRPELLPQCLERYRADRYANRELVIVLHGGAGGAAALRTMVRPGESVTVLEASRERSLGDCLNMAVAHSNAPVWMKLDDDDHYGPNYTSDMMLYRRMVKAPLLGKPPMFLHLQQEQRLYWDGTWAEHANLLHHADRADAALVAGGTLAGDRGVLESVKFSSTRRGGSDSEFVRRAYEHGFHVLAADGFNFVRFRGAEPRSHTWQVPDHALRERAADVGPDRDIAAQAFI